MRGAPRMNSYKRYALSVDEDIYDELKELSQKKGMPMSKVINRILRGYIKARKERNDK